MYSDQSGLIVRTRTVNKYDHSVLFVFEESNLILIVFNAKLASIQALKTKVVHLSPGTSC